MLEPGMTRIGFLGLGTMGSGMAANLLKAGHDLTVWNRSPERAEPLIGQGATRADTPAQAAQSAEIVMYCLSNDAAVEGVVWGDDGVLSSVQSGQIVIDLSTVHPDLSRREAAAYAEKGVAFLDAPVFGSKNEAAQGGLWIVVGGERALFDRVAAVLESLSETLHYMGDTGSGTSMKLVGNLIVAAQLEALGEAMILATKAGLRPDDVLGVLRVTDFRSPILSNVGAALIARDFSPAFALKHLLKDANLIARFAEGLNAPLPASATIRGTIVAAVNQGWGDENASAMIKALEQQAQVTVGGEQQERGAS